jgi:hypothetical protein
MFEKYCLLRENMRNLTPLPPSLLGKVGFKASPLQGYPLPGSFSTFTRVFTHFLTLITSSLILNKKPILARIKKPNLSSMLDPSVFNMTTEQAF